MILPRLTFWVIFVQVSVFHHVHELVLFNREFSSRGGSSRGGLSRGGGEFDRGQSLDDSYRGELERASTVHLTGLNCNI